MKVISHLWITLPWPCYLSPSSTVFAVPWRSCSIGTQKALGVSEEVWQAAELREQQVTMVGGRGTALLSRGVPVPLPSDFVAIFPVFSPLHKEA